MTTAGPVKSRTENARAQAVFCAPHGRRINRLSALLCGSTNLRGCPFHHRARFCSCSRVPRGAQVVVRRRRFNADTETVVAAAAAVEGVRPTTAGAAAVMASPVTWLMTISRSLHSSVAKNYNNTKLFQRRFIEIVKKKIFRCHK